MKRPKFLSGAVLQAQSRATKKIIKEHENKNQGKRVSEILEYYKHKFAQWLYSVQDQLMVQAIGLQDANQATTKTYQQILENNSSSDSFKILKRKGLLLIEDFQRDFGFNISYMLVSGVVQDGPNAYVRVDIPKITAPVFDKDTGYMSDSLTVRAKQGNFDRRANSINYEHFSLPLNIKQFNSEDLVNMYIETINNNFEDIAKAIDSTISMSLIDKFSGQNLKITTNSSPNMGYATEGFVVSSLIKQHIEQIREWYNDYLQAPSNRLKKSLTQSTRMLQGNFNKTKVQELSFNADSIKLIAGLRELIIPDSIAFIFKGDFEYRDVNNILLKSKFLHDEQNSKNSVSKMNKAIQKIHRRINMTNPLRYQIKGEGGQVSITTMYNFIARMHYLLCDDNFKKKIQNIGRDHFNKIIQNLGQESNFSTEMINLAESVIQPKSESKSELQKNLSNAFNTLSLNKDITIVGELTDLIFVKNLT